MGFTVDAWSLTLLALLCAWPTWYVDESVFTHNLSEKWYADEWCVMEIAAPEEYVQAIAEHDMQHDSSVFMLAALGYEPNNLHDNLIAYSSWGIHGHDIMHGRDGLRLP